MGEAKRRREAALKGPCPCGSNKPARLCCFTGRVWHKPFEILGLKALPQDASLERCYMKELGSCAPPISGEHLISASVIRVLQGDGEFSISGVPWLEIGEQKILSVKNLTTNCLCRKHNSALNPLDTAAGYFFASLKSSLEQGPGPRHALVSGHDIERWLLKTAKAMAVSDNFARGSVPITGGLSRDASIMEMLDNPRQWPDGAGLYCVMNTGDTTVNHSRFRLQPLTNDLGEIEALHVDILGLRFALLLAPPDAHKHAFLVGAKYRPSRVVISYPSWSNWVTMSWDDGKPHEELTIQFVKRVPPENPHS